MLAPSKLQKLDVKVLYKILSIANVVARGYGLSGRALVHTHTHTHSL